LYQNKIYFFTKKNGVYVEENGSLSPGKPFRNFKTANINVAHFLKNNKLVVGTSSRGVYVLILIRIPLILTEIM
jgi:hypothetical protein